MIILLWRQHSFAEVGANLRGVHALTDILDGVLGKLYVRLKELHSLLKSLVALLLRCHLLYVVVWILHVLESLKLVLYGALLAFKDGNKVLEVDRKFYTKRSVFYDV